MSEYLLAIETSCDETSISILKDNEVISLVTNTQIDSFEEIGGVVPELASRMHTHNILYVYAQALKEAKVSIKDIDVICVTNGPGLIGALLIGVNFAKTLSLIHDIKLIEINHLHGHIYSSTIDNEITYPHLSLIVSGGHTELIYLEKELSYKKLGSTLDDAAGECFDKVARLLDLGYPGGPKIDNLAKNGSPTYDLPIPKNDDSFDFSFSGLKSASYNLNNTLNMKNEKLNKEDFACSFQSIVIQSLLNKFEMAYNQYKPNSISVVGGVSANSYLREQFLEKYPNIIFPDKKYTSDNAAMIAKVGWLKYKNNKFIDLKDLNANPNLKI